MVSKAELELWITRSKLTVGKFTLEKDWVKVLQVFYIWCDLFVSDVLDMPTTNLMEHHIPTYTNTRPEAATLQQFTEEEECWEQENLLKLVEAKVISQSDSQWAAGTKFPQQKNSKLQMVHVLCLINTATIKSNYPM
jgi:hypothetical protein